MTSWDGTPLTLTDDELLAVVVLGDGELWAPIPTVQLADPAAAGRACARGRRSLAVRGLTDDDGPAPYVLDAVARVTGDRPSVAVVTVDDDLDWFPAGLTFLVHVAGPTHVLHVVSAGGVHELSALEPTRVDAIVDLLAAVRENGFEAGADVDPDDGVPTGLSVAVGDATFVARPGVLVTGMRGVDADPPVDEAVLDDVRRALERELAGPTV